MVKSPTYFLKTLLVIFGGGLLLFSGFMPVINRYTMDFIGNRVVENFQGSISGFQSPLWYAILIATAVIFSIGYFFTNKANRILVFAFTPIFAFGIWFQTFVFTFSIAMDSGDTITEIGHGYTFAVIGAIMVVLATIISVLRPRQKSNTQTSDLLDN